MSEDTQDAFERGFMLGFDEGVKQGKELGRQIPTYPTIQPDKYPSYPYSPVIWSSGDTHHNCLNPSVIAKPE